MTPKQEAFALKYVECGNASEAYRTAYDVGENTKPETIWVKACEALKNGKVAARVVELQMEAQERHQVTIASLTKELDEDRELARTEKQAAAAISAVNSKAKLHGLTDKIKGTGENGEIVHVHKADPELANAALAAIGDIARQLAGGLEKADKDALPD